jgi:hypothetical protein
VLADAHLPHVDRERKACGPALMVTGSCGWLEACYGGRSP